MNQQTTGRMLLAHNFNVSEDEIPPLTREEFARVFIEGLQSQNNINCRLIDNPHWVVEIIFSTTEFSPKEVGAICGQILLNKRQQQKLKNQTVPNILILGGKKTSPAINTSSTSLKPGEWGVDVVETKSATAFLAAIQWELKTSKRPIDNIFKIEL